MRQHATLIALPLVLLGVMSSADAAGRNRLGVNGSYSLGGNVEKPEPGYGFQAEWGLNEHWGLELAASEISDQSTDTGIKITQNLGTLGLSIVGRQPFTDRLQGYALVGADYNMPSTAVTLDPGVFGPGWRANIQMDDAWGWHAGLGLGLTLARHVEVILEYRYTALQLRGTMNIGDGSFVYQDSIRGDYDFGLIKLGLNVLF